MQEQQGKILIIDDNNEFLVALKILLSPHFGTVVTEISPDRIPHHLRNDRFDVVILDMNFRAGVHSGNEGFYWMTKIKEIDDETSVIFITAYGDVDLAIRSLKEGAVDFIQKSWDEHKILATVLSAYNLKKSNVEINKLKRQKQHLKAALKNDRPPLVKGPSEVMSEVYDLIDKVSVTDANVLITGESGTGKEIVARELHRKSLRNNGLFISVDLGSIHENLFESELFGHAKGAFTDAAGERAGRVELATGGTLFLDEISNLSVTLQKKLLTVLQNKTLVRLGENIPRHVDFRLISATNKSLDKMVINRSFREDLLYRLRTVEIHLPPLRERLDDIPALSEYFLGTYSTKYNKSLMNMTGPVIERLLKYDWPGNIRELQNVIEKAVILAEGKQLKSSDFMLTPTVKVKSDLSKTFNLEENEREVITRALNTFNWNMTKTARELGINRSTLYEKLKKYEL
jgi:DNA-binding NtrC family response regulator